MLDRSDLGRVGCAEQFFKAPEAAVDSHSNRCKPVDFLRLQLPGEDVRLQVKQRIITAFKEWKLSFRIINVESERVYLNSEKKAPRPVYLVAEDISVSARPKKTVSDMACVTVGVIDPEYICAYKRNAVTSDLVDTGAGVDTLAVKCLSNLDALQDKMREQAYRKEWGVYKPFTSGHLAADGTFTLPKAKSFDQCNPGPLPHSELLTVGYEKRQLVCFCITDSDENIAAALKKKHQLEQTMGLDSLPIALYSGRSGTLEVWFEEELLSKSEAAQLGKIESQMYECARSLSIDPIALQKIQTYLTLPHRIDFINAYGSSYVAPAEELPTVSDLIDLVTIPEAYSAERLRDWFERGVWVGFKVFHQGEHKTLLRLLVETEEERAQARRKNPDCDPTSYDACSAKAVALFQELYRCGAKDLFGESLHMMYFYAYRVTHLYDSLCAIGCLTVIPKYYSSSFFSVFPMSAGGITSIDKWFGLKSEGQLQNYIEGLLLRPFQIDHQLPDNYEQCLMILFYYDADPRPFLDELLVEVRKYRVKYSGEYYERGCEAKRNSWSYTRMCGGRTPNEYVDTILSLWEKRESNPLFKGWPEKVAAAKAEIEQLKGEMTPYPATRKTDLQESNNVLLQTLKQAFAHPPSLSRVTDSDETVFEVLQHYYRRPGPESVLQSVGRRRFPEIWKRGHDCSHALRTRNNAHWYMLLLEQFNLAKFSDEEKALLGLAAVYHDAAAEDVKKQEEEQRSAFYFMRDCHGHFDGELLARVAKALQCKEDDRYDKDKDTAVDGQLRNCIRVLRFADRMDFVRCSTVESDFPAWNTGPTDTDRFDVDLLDIPPQQREKFSSDPAQKTEFQRALEACMHGAVDLSSVTGDCGGDKRPQKSYLSRYGLPVDRGAAVKRSFERTPNPLTHMNRFVDDNVRRKVAASAGVVTCSDPKHGVCQADVRKGVTRGIHNSLFDLEQVQLPPGMTLVDKMLCEHDFELLRKEIREELEQEIGRLKREGIAMNTGTLTQQVLRSAEAVKTLSERGIDVVKSKRQRGFDESGEPLLEELLVPVNERISGPER